jgi:alanyl-tRNA synthetase
MEFDEAVAGGAMALFGEKYDKDVRVLRLGDFSLELCGGTHVERAGDIGLFKIVSESGISSGVRRIEALTGEAALDYVEESDEILKEVSGLVRGSRDELRTKVRDALERVRAMEREIRTLKEKLAAGPGVDLAAGAVDVGGVKVVATRVEGADVAALRHVVDQLKNQLKSAVVVLATVENPSKVSLIVGVTADQSSRIPAGELVATLARTVGGRGGGRADFAQAGGNNPAALESALAQVPEFVRARLV